MKTNKKHNLDLVIGNLSNAVLHKILEKSIKEEYLANKYSKEIFNSLNIAKKYREKLNPKQEKLSDKNRTEIIEKIKKNVSSELRIRINKGYKNLENFDLDFEIISFFQEMRI